MRILIAGGAGFVGSAAARQTTSHGLRVFDKPTHAGLVPVAHEPRYMFRKGNIGDTVDVKSTFGDFDPNIRHVSPALLLKMALNPEPRNVGF